MRGRAWLTGSAAADQLGKETFQEALRSLGIFVEMWLDYTLVASDTKHRECRLIHNMQPFITVRNCTIAAPFSRTRPARVKETAGFCFEIPLCCRHPEPLLLRASRYQKRVSDTSGMVQRNSVRQEESFAKKALQSRSSRQLLPRDKPAVGKRNELRVV